MTRDKADSYKQLIEAIDKYYRPALENLPQKCGNTRKRKYQYPYPPCLGSRASLPTRNTTRRLRVVKGHGNSVGEQSELATNPGKSLEGLTMGKYAGDEFQEATKYRRNQMSGRGLDWASKPDIYKEYPNCKKIDLSLKTGIETLRLDEVLLKRRSIRKYAPQALNVDQLSFLLWASSGIQRVEQGYAFRTAPSAGALYPIETYVAANRIEGLPAGVYHYSVKHHCLDVIKIGDFSGDVASAALGQMVCAEAAAVFMWTAIFQRSKWKYGQRAYRYVYLDAGHIGQNLALAGTAMGLGTCQIGALFDDEVNRIVGVDGVEESVVYMSSIGKPA